MVKAKVRGCILEDATQDILQDRGAIWQTLASLGDKCKISLVFDSEPVFEVSILYEIKGQLMTDHKQGKMFTFFLVEELRPAVKNEMTSDIKIEFRLVSVLPQDTTREGVPFIPAIASVKRGTHISNLHLSIFQPEVMEQVSGLDLDKYIVSLSTWSKIRVSRNGLVYIKPYRVNSIRLTLKDIKSSERSDM